MNERTYQKIISKLEVQKSRPDPLVDQQIIVFVLNFENNKTQCPVNFQKIDYMINTFRSDGIAGNSSPVNIYLSKCSEF